jgi:hypothetical protein
VLLLKITPVEHFEEYKIRITISENTTKKVYLAK